MEIPRQYAKLNRLVEQHEKRVEAFQLKAEKFFHPHAVSLCKRIKKGIPGFERAYLAMRRLWLVPLDLPITVINREDNKPHQERISNVLSYLDEDGSYRLGLPEDTIEALRELDELADYIDDNYSMVNGLDVTL